MQVTIKLFATLRDLLPPEAKDGAIIRDLAPGTNVGDVLSQLKVPDDGKLILLLNSVHADRHAALREGDVLAVFPPIAGG
jgi:sulfur-carrier protein